MTSSLSWLFGGRNLNVLCVAYFGDALQLELDHYERPLLWIQTRHEYAVNSLEGLFEPSRKNGKANMARRVRFAESRMYLIYEHSRVAPSFAIRPLVQSKAAATRGRISDLRRYP